jgi:hypothetical protein
MQAPPNADGCEVGDPAGKAGIKGEQADTTGAIDPRDAGTRAIRLLSR